MSRELRKYGQDALFFLPAIDAGAVDFNTSPTLAAGDGKLFSYGGGSPQINTNLSAEMVAFTSGSEEPSAGDTLVGASSSETAVFMFAVVTSGTWGGGDAAGFLFVKTVSGAFSGENINISGGTSNVLTIGGDVTAGLVGSIGNGDIVFALTATEMSCKLGSVTFIDSATKDWEDNKIMFATFGNANAQYAVDFSITVPTATAIVDEWKTQSQADPTGFHVNVQEWKDSVPASLTDTDKLQASVQHKSSSVGLSDQEKLDANAEADTALSDYAPAQPGDQMALADDAITAGKFDQTTAFPMTAADGSDLTEVGGDGAQLTEAGGTGDHLTAVQLADAEDVYHADIELTIDEANTRDEYTVTWFRNGIRQTTGITSPTIQVVKRADGTDLIASDTMTEIGSTGSYKYDEATNRITNGEAVLVLVGATINSSARTFSRLLGRDASA